LLAGVYERKFLVALPFIYAIWWSYKLLIHLIIVYGIDDDTL